MIISVDQGFSNYGFTIWKDNQILLADIIQTHKDIPKGTLVVTDMLRRHLILSTALNNLFLTYKPNALVGEMPGFGAQSASAMRNMTMASAITLTLCMAHKIQTIWHDPREIKKHFTGDPNAPKEVIMMEACKRHNWEITYKTVKHRFKCRLPRRDPMYHVMGKRLPKAKFEHIADSIAAYYTARHFYKKGN